MLLDHLPPWLQAAALVCAPFGFATLAAYAVPPTLDRLARIWVNGRRYRADLRRHRRTARAIARGIR